jgi:hypothetical protein
LRVHHGVLLFIGGTLNLRTLNPFSKKLNQFYRKEFTLSFKMPRETYGAYISYDENKNIVIDSLSKNVYHPKYNTLYSDETVSYEDFMRSKKELAGKIKMEFGQDLVDLFYKYGVYYIQRLSRSYAPEDTLPRYVFNRNKGKRVLTKSSDKSKLLSIRFSRKDKTKKLMQELRRIPSVLSIQFVTRPIEDSVPNDTEYDDSSLQSKYHRGQYGF